MNIIRNEDFAESIWMLPLNLGSSLTGDFAPVFQSPECSPHPPRLLDEAAAAVADGSRKESRGVGESKPGPKSVSR